MSTDIVPELLESIEKKYNFGIKNSIVLGSIRRKIKSEKVTYKDADTYAREVARILSSSYGEYMNAKTLPNGIFYYNIAKRIIEPTVKAAIKEVDDTTADIQAALNKKTGLGIKVIRPQINQDRIDEIIERLSMEGKNAK